jgi:hypothetical protein
MSNTHDRTTRGGSLRPSRPTDPARQRPDEDDRDATLDQTIEDTFPASDPPSSIPDPDTRPEPPDRDRRR